jgi:hypothetical protein
MLVNQAALVRGVEVTLLSYVIVDDVIRVHGAVRVSGSHEARLVSVPELQLMQVGSESPMPTLGAHVLPRPPIIWLVWTLGLPGEEPRALSARIGQLAFGYRTGSKADVVDGPWLFENIKGPMDRPEPALHLVTAEA